MAVNSLSRVVQQRLHDGRLVAAEGSMVNSIGAMPDVLPESVASREELTDGRRRCLMRGLGSPDLRELRLR